MALRNIRIPASVAAIGSYAFSRCSNLVDVSCEAQIPPTISYDTFSSYGNLHVDIGCKDRYANDVYWKNFFIEEDIAGIENIMMSEMPVESCYDMCGRQIGKIKNGLGVVRYKDGSIRKVYLRK
jgi:hypothetical protein